MFIRRSMPLVLAATLLLALAPVRSAPPAWFLEHLAQEMEGGGRRIADNAEHFGPGEPYDAYGVEWTWGVGKVSLRGRLFALREGREVADMWEMRSVWHPGANEARAYQYGADGTFAVGTIQPLEDGAVEIVQTFSAPDGSMREVRHESLPLEGGGSVTHSFERDGEDWKPNRSYIWVSEERSAETDR